MTKVLSSFKPTAENYDPVLDKLTFTFDLNFINISTTKLCTLIQQNTKPK